MKISIDTDAISISPKERRVVKTNNTTRVLRRKRTGRDVVAFTVYMDPEALTVLRHCAIDEGVPPSDLLVSTFQEYRKQRGL